MDQGPVYFIPFCPTVTAVSCFSLISTNSCNVSGFFFSSWFTLLLLCNRLTHCKDLHVHDDGKWVFAVFIKNRHFTLGVRVFSLNNGRKQLLPCLKKLGLPIIVKAALNFKELKLFLTKSVFILSCQPCKTV